MNWPPSGSFEIAPWPIVQRAPKLISDVSKPITALSYRDDATKKREFGIHLAKGLKPFEAGIALFDDANKALWVSQNWPNDPLVIEAQQNRPVDSKKLLDKEELAARFLAISEEKDPTGRFYVNEAKDRIASLKVYAEICGYVGKVEIDNSTKNFNNKTMNIHLVNPPVKELPEKVIEHREEENIVTALPLQVKLVS